MRTLLIVNPAAGHGRGEKAYRRLEARLSRDIPGLEVRFSQRPGHAVELGRQAAREGVPRVLCLGGDGTAFEVVNGLRDEGHSLSPVAVGLIPAGTGNSFLRDFGITTPEAALESIVAGRRRTVDLVEMEYRDGGRTERRVSLNIIGVGLIADILKLTNERLKGFGALGYSIAVFVRLARGMDNRIALVSDGRARDIEDSALVISNSQYTGGAMRIAPAADPADGKADLVVFRGVNRREIVAIFGGVFSGRHVRHPKVEMETAVVIEVTGKPPLRLMADGELLGETPLRARVLPGELTILA
jgi:diacylglycerol kinase (ATP)